MCVVSPFYEQGTRILRLPRKKQAFNKGEPWSTLLYSTQLSKAYLADFLSHFFMCGVQRSDARHTASDTCAEGDRCTAAGNIDLPVALAAMRKAWL
jgi:hypothetical protein